MAFTTHSTEVKVQVEMFSGIIRVIKCDLNNNITDIKYIVLKYIRKLTELLSNFLSINPLFRYIVTRS